MYAEDNKWIPRIIKKCFKRPGQHILFGGTTGTGKTQGIFHFIRIMREEVPEELLLVFDIGKSSEVLRLADFGDLLFFIPAGKKLEFEFISKELEEKYKPRIYITWFKTYEQIFNELEKDKINIVCIKPFHRRADTYAKEVSTFFQTLRDMAMDKRLKIKKKIPLSIILDEIHWVAPGLGSSLNDEHTEAGKDVQMNIDTLRSARIRMVGSTQNWTKLRKGVRDAFPWIFIRRGLSFSPQDEPRLSRYNLKWEGLSDNEMVVAFPKRDYSDTIELPYYGEGEEIGDIFYLEDINPISPSEMIASQAELILPQT